MTTQAERNEHVSEVQRWAERLSQSYLYCRTFGHTWKPWTAHWNPDERCYEQIIRCGRCKNERVQLLDRYGQVIKSWYRYPHGYLHKALGRITGEGRGALRLEALKRQIAKPPSQE